MKWPIVSFTAVGNVPDIPAFITAEEETSAERARCQRCFRPPVFPDAARVFSEASH